VSLQIKYMDVPEGARKASVVAADAGQPFPLPQQLAEGVADVPWATLEPGGWMLDGSRKLLPDTPRQMGWWSCEPSEADGTFSDPPVIRLTFPQPYTATGLTFRFWPSKEEWCSHIRVAWYRGDGLIDQADAYPNAAEWVFFYPVENFDAVEICLLQTNSPGRYAKLQQLQIGRVMVFMGDELVEVRLLNETDPSLCALTVDTMTVALRDRKGRNLLPQKDQIVELYRDGVLLATHSITDAQRQSRQNYRLRSQSAIGRLEGSFLGGIYEQYPLENLLQEVLRDFAFGVDPAFTGKTVTGYLPVCTRRQALQQITFAVGAAVTSRGDGSIWLQLPEETVSGGFTAGRIFAGGRLKQEPPVAAVELFVHHYSPGDEEKILLKETMVTGEGVLFVFSEPFCDYQITGGTLADSDANWVRITANGPVTLSAKKYRHTVSVHRKENSQAAEKGNVVTVEKATLVNGENASDILQRLYTYHTLQSLLTQDVVAAGEKAGQLVESLSPWGDRVTGYISSMESTFTDTGHTANIQIRGREVQVQ